MRRAAQILLIVVALASAQTFDVASIKPNVSGSDRMTWGGPPGSTRFTATNINLKTLIRLAWKVKDSEIFGGPGWIESDRYDIAARPPEGTVSFDQSRLMLQKLLADRFGLTVHRETREIPVFALLPGKNGPKLTDVKPGGCVTLDAEGHPPPGRQGQTLPPCGAFLMGPNLLTGANVSTALFADALSNIVNRRVVDKTGFTGTFMVRLEFTPVGLDNPDAPATPSIFTAIEEQMGLRLESAKAPAEVLVIDHVERIPTGN
jgi:uncharacterized protein (TIGR03435 family)